MNWISWPSIPDAAEEERKRKKKKKGKKKENKTFGRKTKKNDDIGSGLRIGAEEGSGAARREAAAAFLLQGSEDRHQDGIWFGLVKRERERESVLG